MKKLMLLFAVMSSTLSVNAQSVEDSVKYQIGYELHYLSDAAPRDITVIGRQYGGQDEGMPYPDAVYRYINHDREDAGYEPFSAEYLKASYASYLTSDTTNIYGYWRPVYVNQIERTRQIIGAPDKNVGRRLRDYVGYWVGLTEYEGDFYLEQCSFMECSFRIEAETVDVMNMEGPDPYVIKSVGYDDRRGLVITTYFGEDKHEFTFRLVDAERKIYKSECGSYMTPASNSRNFDMIQYCSRYGDMIDW